ncbi:MAG: DUF3168 domain-containing protein [Thermomicrobia bacterium]|nr:DUF3168 domain-containing protein [Thermomicrobia bacterium]
MDDDVVYAIIQQLRTVTAITTLVGTRIYPAAQVPPEGAFPRGMVGSHDGSPDEWMDGGQYSFRYPLFTVEWVSTNVISSTPLKDVQLLDRLANDALRGTLVVPNLTFLQRHRVIKPMAQDNDNVEYISGGGMWIAHREYAYLTP